MNHLIENISVNKSFGGWHKQYSHQSKSLNCTMRFAIYLPPQVSKGEKVPVLYWLLCYRFGLQHHVLPQHRALPFWWRNFLMSQYLTSFARHHGGRLRSFHQFLALRWTLYCFLELHLRQPSACLILVRTTVRSASWFRFLDLVAKSLFGFRSPWAT